MEKNSLKFSFLEWQLCHYPVMVFCSSRAIYLGVFQFPLWGRLVFLSPISNYFEIELGMAQLYDLTYLVSNGFILEISMCQTLFKIGELCSYNQIDTVLSPSLEFFSWIHRTRHTWQTDILFNNNFWLLGRIGWHCF